jgi:hypothetical protein
LQDLTGWQKRDLVENIKKIIFLYYEVSNSFLSLSKWVLKKKKSPVKKLNIRVGLFIKIVKYIYSWLGHIGAGTITLIITTFSIMTLSIQIN